MVSACVAISRRHASFYFPPVHFLSLDRYIGLGAAAARMAVEVDVAVCNALGYRQGRVFLYLYVIQGRLYDLICLLKNI
jgi:hypothetical protein